MISKIRKHKTFIKGVAIVTVLLIIILGIDAISETENWAWFNLDFTKKQV